MSKNFSIEKTDKNKSSVFMEVEIPSDLLENEFLKELKSQIEDAELPGFRKGKVPEGVFIQKYGELNILEKAASSAVNKILPELIKESKIRPITYPSASIIKIARKNPLIVKFEFVIYPEFKLPDYKKIAASVPEEKSAPEVSEGEVEKVVNDLRKQYAHHKLHEDNPNLNHNHKPIEETDLPVLTDEIASKLGDFKDVIDLKTKIKEGLLKEKEIKIKEKRRVAILDGIINATDVEVPEVMVKNELEKMLAEFKGEIERVGAKFEDYIKHIGKSEDELKKEWFPQAQKKAELDLIIPAISESEKLSVDNESIRKDSEKLLTLYPNIDPVKVRGYVEGIYLNQTVLNFLENL